MTAEKFAELRQVLRLVVDEQEENIRIAERNLRRRLNRADELPESFCGQGLKRLVRLLDSPIVDC